MDVHQEFQMSISLRHIALGSTDQAAPLVI
jgi:hypothetical protein